MDDFYNCNELERQLATLRDRECAVLGTVSINNINCTNGQAIKNVSGQLRAEESGK